mmetsp:Transcript_10992/g.25582  ORF Transcript_10992/g.25582 Transcript_10992/m.25582 type:complete len:98 (+) Transcript_10992:638-931(+)
MIHAMMIVAVILNKRLALADPSIVPADFDGHRTGLGKIIANSQLDKVLVEQAIEEVAAMTASVLPDGLDAVRPITEKLIVMEIGASSREEAFGQDSA